jgi:sensory rhodopsin
MDILALTTQYCFFIAFSGMAAGALYFTMESKNLALEYRPVATLSAMVAFIAAINYWLMKTTIGMDGQVETVLKFQTDLRYIDWVLTTPLILCIFPALLGMRGKTTGLLTKLVLADLVMIIAGYFGEVEINRAHDTMTGWVCFVIAMGGWAFIMVTLWGLITNVAQEQPIEIRRTLDTLKVFLLVGWTVYPLGYMLPLLEAGPTASMLRELVYCIADVVNKVGFGMIAVAAAKRMSYTWVNDEQGNSHASMAPAAQPSY